jgi:hypothetical protein
LGNHQQLHRLHGIATSALITSLLSGQVKSSGQPFNYLHMPTARSTSRVGSLGGINAGDVSQDQRGHGITIVFIIAPFSQTTPYFISSFLLLSIIIKVRIVEITGSGTLTDERLDPISHFHMWWAGTTASQLGDPYKLGHDGEPV